MTNRIALYLLMLFAPLAWGGLFVFTHFVPPQTLLAYTTFFVLLGVALTSTFSPLAYFIFLRFIPSRLYRATVSHALLQDPLLALWIVFNLLLPALHSCTTFTAVVRLAISLV